MTDVVLLSLWVALLAVACTLPLALMLGWWLARSRSSLRAPVDLFVHLPLVVPPVVTGFVLLTLFGPRGPLGGLGLGFSTAGAAVAAGVVAFPLLVRPIRQAFESQPAGFRAAAMSLGARPWRVFWTVELPLARRGIAAGAFMAFGRALGEFGATITFVGSIAGETETLPLALHVALAQPGGEAAAWAFAAASVALAIFALIAHHALMRGHR